MLSTPFICCSIGVATDCSMVSASAPVNEVVSTICGGMICGNCAIGSPSSETTPRRTVTMAITIATIGLRMKKEDIALVFRRGGRCGRRPRIHRGAAARLLQALDHYPFAPDPPRVDDPQLAVRGA